RLLQEKDCIGRRHDAGISGRGRRVGPLPLVRPAASRPLRGEDGGAKGRLGVARGVARRSGNGINQRGKRERRIRWAGAITWQRTPSDILVAGRLQLSDKRRHVVACLPQSGDLTRLPVCAPWLTVGELRDTGIETVALMDACI